MSETAENRKRVLESALKPVPMGYLREGERFYANRPVGRRVEHFSGVADMDGWMVSPHYGFPSGNLQSIAYTQKYINVKFDGQEYRGKGRPWRVNDTLFEADGWVFFVTPEVYRRVQEDIKVNVQIEFDRAAEGQKAKNASKKQALLNQIEVLRRQAEAL